MRILLLILLPFLCSSQIDKTLHYCAGAGISVMSGSIVYKITDDIPVSLSTGFLLGSMAGYAKEVHDRPNFDEMDFYTTVWGSANGMIMLRVIIDVKEKKREKKFNYTEYEF
jgi:hypothetical protein